MTRRSGARSRAFTLAATAAASALLHAGGLAAASQLRTGRAARPPPAVVEFEAAPPPAPAPPPRPHVANDLAPAKAAAPPDAPPPPNEPAPPEAARERPVPRVGVSLSSTASGGAFAVGIGNTLHGRADEIAAAPEQVRAYAAPPRQPATQPRPLELPDIAYPPEARRAGVEGKVVLLLRVDAAGRVAAAHVISEPGSGLGDAARAGAFLFRFSPALLDGEPVETEIRFTYTFVLE